LGGGVQASLRSEVEQRLKVGEIVSWDYLGDCSDKGHEMELPGGLRNRGDINVSRMSA
jgi:hypothetical protein